jgi:hypothetical protein
MKRNIVTALSILAVAAGLGWQLASHPATAAGLQEVRLSQHSEHSHPGTTKALAGIRIRLSGAEIRATNHKVPQIAVAAE